MSSIRDCQYSVVIPCYRSAETLAELVQRLRPVMESLGKPYEVLLVNDASPDDTWQVIGELAARYPEVRGIDLQFNTGQYRAILCGLEHARGQIVVLMDDDLQHPPEEVPVLVRALEEHPQWDCVMGRYVRKHHSWWRNLGSAAMTWLNSWLYGKPRHVVGSSFQAMRKGLAQALCQHGAFHFILNPVIYRTTRRIGNVPVRHEPRRRGRSNYGPLKLLGLVVNNILSASTLPLRMLSLFGFLTSALSAVLALWYFLLWLTHHTKQSGFTTLVLLVLFFGGMTLLGIGLVGEYLLRIMDEVRRPPRYVIRGTAGGLGPSASNSPGAEGAKGYQHERSTAH